MRRLLLLTVALNCLIAAVAIAAETPGSPLQPPSTGRAPAANTYTIEELYKNAASLNGKKVVVRGQVVKMTDGIMGKAWTHIQDGTGDGSKGNNDLICISRVVMGQVGAVVTVTGTAVFNPESRYKLVLQDAALGN